MPDGELPLGAGAPDSNLQKFSHLRDYIRNGRAPWRQVARRRQTRLVNADGPGNVDATPLHDYAFLSNLEFDACLLSRFRDDLAIASAHALANENPEDSARSVFSTGQVIAIISMTALFAALSFSTPGAVWIFVTALASLYFLAALIFRVYLIAISKPSDGTSGAAFFDRAHAPVISILIPLYREAAAAPAIIQAVAALDYPEEKKDVIFLIEEDDSDTRREVQKFLCGHRFRILNIPDVGPKTKPKACNIGLYMSRGDIIVIYDAEDRPEPDQLKKAAIAFADAPDNVVCVQAKLNYYNRDECWLTRMFTLEYSLWFDWLLPALQRMEAPIPLGGTSNFFRTKTLFDIGGWDPYNVTEDADLGLRLARRGLKTAILNSTTFEEANCRLGNWLRQRSRWLKGYMQTWLVHMRKPRRIIRRSGWSGFFAVQLFVLGNVASAVINPLLLAAMVVGGLSASVIDLPKPLQLANLFALTIGNSVFAGLMMIGPSRRPWRWLGLWGVTAPAYWLLSSLAAYKAIWQLFVKPHFWEKTDHVISRAAITMRAAALEKLGEKAT